MGTVFTDTEGRKWTVTLNVAALARVKSLCAVNLLSVVEPESKLLQELSTDPVQLCNVLYAIVKPEADGRAVTDAAFGAALGGDALAEATEALIQGVIDFFPKARRSLFQKAFDRAKVIQTKQEVLAAEGLEKILDAAEASLVARNPLSGNAPESSAATPQA